MSVFGLMKFNIAYRRLRHFGKDKVTMDFALFALAFNIKKCAQNSGPGQNEWYVPHQACFAYLSVFISLQSNILAKSRINRLKNIQKSEQKEAAP